MVPKLNAFYNLCTYCFRAVLFRMVPKQIKKQFDFDDCFRAVLFRMVPKPTRERLYNHACFRAVLFRMVPTHIKSYSFFK